MRYDACFQVVAPGGEILVYDIDRVILSCDGAPRNKVTGIKGSGHNCRFTFGLEQGWYTHRVFVQSRKYMFELKDLFEWYDIEKSKWSKVKSKKDIESMYLLYMLRTVMKSLKIFTKFHETYIKYQSFMKLS